MSAYKVLTEQVAQISDILNAISVLTWDARTQMPPGVRRRADSSLRRSRASPTNA